MQMIIYPVQQLLLILVGKFDFEIYYFFCKIYSLNNSTILIEPNCEATVTDCGDIRISIEYIKDETDSTELDLIKLSIFQNRFMSIAEQCGR